ncbi:lipopolysaccharide biosynthesis protein [Pseudoduganella violaceinigra]|uniref:lipopolysaccharide biosynthesis protein n=1 Tax=Pseudoduganella violaceinigra TaxID=246602 RepID=UPI0003F986EE|nr:lipopolysaccharide biosynthesis protein [Pseudoduganella violaceinigra]
MNLQSEVARGVKWVAGAKLGSQVITWGITIYVMRLLLPTDYGLLAMATVLLGLLLMFSEVGLGPALVQRKEVSEQDFRKALGIIWLVNLLLFALANAAAPLVAAFYHEPRLQALVHALSSQFLLLPLVVLPDAQLQRDLAYRERSLIELGGAVGGSLVTLALALTGAGVWALALGTLASLLLRALALNCCAPSYWRPQWPGQGMGALLGFGGKMTAARLLWYCFMQADILIVGRVLGDQLLGLYSVSMHLASLPMQRITAILNQALFPVLARAQHDMPAIRAGVLQVLGYVGLLAFPMLWGMASVAPELVHVVLGPGWSGAVLPLQVLCLIMPFRALAQLLPTVTDALGQPGVGLRNVILGCTVMPPAFYLSSRWGIQGIAFAWLLVYPLVLMLNMRRMLKVIGLGAGDVVRRAGPAVLCAALMFGAVTLLRAPLAAQPRAWALVAEVLGGMLAYGLACLAFNRAMVAEVRGMLRRGAAA